MHNKLLSHLNSSPPFNEGFWRNSAGENFIWRLTNRQLLIQLKSGCVKNVKCKKIELKYQEPAEVVLNLKELWFNTFSASAGNIRTAYGNASQICAVHLLTFPNLKEHLILFINFALLSFQPHLASPMQCGTCTHYPLRPNKLIHSKGVHRLPLEKS